MCSPSQNGGYMGVGTNESPAGGQSHRRTGGSAYNVLRAGSESSHSIFLQEQQRQGYDVLNAVSPKSMHVHKNLTARQGTGQAATGADASRVPASSKSLPSSRDGDAEESLWSKMIQTMNMNSTSWRGPKGQGDEGAGAGTGSCTQTLV